MEEQVCLNPDCNSYGSEHPNCECYGGMASGGVAGRFCDKKQAHQPGCQYAKGGEVEPGFSIAEDNDTHYTIKHAKGDTLKIAKAGLSKELLSQIQKFKKGGEVQHLYDGGKSKERSVADKFNEAMSAADSAPEMTVASTDQAPPIVPDQMQQPQAPTTVDPESIPTQEAKKPQGQSDASMLAERSQISSDAANAYGQGISDIQRGLKQQATAETNIANESQAVHKQEIEHAQQLANHFQDVYNTVSAEQDKITNEILSNKVDFNRLWHNAGTGSKILAGLGIALSGAGSGMTGQPNLALKVINDAIDRDIGQQKQEMENKKTALGAYQQKFQNADHAAQALRLIYQAGTLAQLAKITNGQGGLMAESKKNILSAQWIPGMKAAQSNLAGEAANWRMIQDQAPEQQPQKPVAMPENLKSKEGGPALGEMRSVNTMKLNAMKMEKGFLAPEEMGKLDEEREGYQKAQEQKKAMLNDFSQMKDSIEKNRELMKEKTYSMKPQDLLVRGATWGALKGVPSDPLAVLQGQKKVFGNLPFEAGKAISELEPMGGEIARNYHSAQQGAILKVTAALGKRATPEIMKRVESLLPDRGDSDAEIKSKIERIMSIIDSNTPTALLTGRGLLK